MKKLRTRTLLIALLIATAVMVNTPGLALAQGINYMDESGNLYFADRIDQVPPRYRNQLQTPTPIPVDKRGRPILPKKPKAEIEKEKVVKKKEKIKNDRVKAQKRREAEEKARQLNRIKKLVPKVERQS